VGQKKLVRKAELPSKRGIAWPRWTGFRGMTIRDWLDLLVVPLALVVISLLFATQQDQRQQEIENRRAKAERELAQQRAQDEALQAYLSQMSSLLLEKDLRESAKDSEVRSLARARTLTVLGRLDSGRKEKLLQFLYEAELIQKANPVIDLDGADLQGIDLSNDRLSGGPFLANYLEALQRLGARPLDGAPASDSELGSSPADLSGANLSGADLSNALLDNASLISADLSGANLPNADLSDADLSNAALCHTDLRDAQGITNEELDQQAASLEGATLPNGQKYEDWLKDKKAKGKDKKNE
jgi:uncharacterized protein YjbI with pentapeptide repeats